MQASSTCHTQLSHVHTGDSTMVVCSHWHRVAASILCVQSVSDWLTDKDAAGEWYADQMVGHEVIFEWCVTGDSSRK